jgi:hypothetical protein
VARQASIPVLLYLAVRASATFPTNSFVIDSIGFLPLLLFFDASWIDGIEEGWQIVVSIGITTVITCWLFPLCRRFCILKILLSIAVFVIIELLGWFSTPISLSLILLGSAISRHFLIFKPFYNSSFVRTASYWSSQFAFGITLALFGNLGIKYVSKISGDKNCTFKTRCFFEGTASKDRFLPPYIVAFIFVAAVANGPVIVHDDGVMLGATAWTLVLPILTGPIDPWGSEQFAVARVLAVKTGLFLAAARKVATIKSQWMQAVVLVVLAVVCWILNAIKP